MVPSTATVQQFYEGLVQGPYGVHRAALERAVPELRQSDSKSRFDPGSSPEQRAPIPERGASPIPVSRRICRQGLVQGVTEPVLEDGKVSAMATV